MSQIFKIIGFSVGLYCLFLAAGFVISFLIDSSLNSLSMVLFVTGGILIIFFAPGLLSRSSSGALHTPVVVYRLVNTLSRKSHATQKSMDKPTELFTAGNLVLVGILLWVASYFV